jgi:ribose 5-phosphate isomerase
MKITRENRNRAIFTKRELNRAADRAEHAHEYLERIDQGLALEVAAAIETLREAERFIGNAITDAGDAIVPADERDATFRPETLDAHLCSVTGVFTKGATCAEGTATR